MPVGEMNFSDAKFVLTEICTNDYFKASCELRMDAKGVLVALVPIPSAPTDRMVRELQMKKENTDLTRSLQESKENSCRPLRR